MADKMILGYCCKERELKPMKDPEEVALKNGRYAIRGICASCGTKMMKFVSAKKTTPVTPAEPRKPESALSIMPEESISSIRPSPYLKSRASLPRERQSEIRSIVKPLEKIRRTKECYDSKGNQDNKQGWIGAAIIGLVVIWFLATRSPASPAPSRPFYVPPAAIPTQHLAPASTQGVCPNGCLAASPGCVIKGNVSFDSGEKPTTFQEAISIMQQQQTQDAVNAGFAPRLKLKLTVGAEDENRNICSQPLLIIRSGN